MAVTTRHNPRCSKSRQTLKLLRGKGIEPTVREYLKQPPSKAEVEELIDLFSGEAKDLIRNGEPEFKKPGKRKADLGTADIAKATVQHAIVLQRPIVVAGPHAAIGQPPEAVLPMLK